MVVYLERFVKGNAINLNLKRKKMAVTGMTQSIKSENKK